MILCHKCSGLLAQAEGENVQGLLGCRCMSGYVRGFEPVLTREQAIERQIRQRDEWISLYKRQGREQAWIDRELELKAQLEAL